MKKEETNDIVQFLLPNLKDVNINKENCKINVTTEKSGKKRGDIWVSLKKQSDKDFENNIIALIEAKHRNATIGDIDWRDAIRQGKEKAPNQGLNYYIITNCKTEFRFYNVHNDDEIILDGKTLTKIVTLEVLQKIQSQTSSDNSYIIHKSSKTVKPLSETKFRCTLRKMANIYRSAGLKKGDERIDPTISFVVLKYISEKELEKRTLHRNIKLWDDLKKIAVEEEVGDLRAEFDKMVDLIWGKDSQYKINVYSDFRDLIYFPIKLKNGHIKKIYNELKDYHFHGANFDLFGSIYEEFASQTKKKEFGEFYTRRHITGMVARLLLRNEVNPRNFKICDHAVGTGGFLTEAYKTLINNYSLSGKLNNDVITNLQDNVFWGYDNDGKSVARAKLNMFLVGDGHIHIYEIDDSLVGWDNEIGWKENEFDYIMTNPPMGKYEGEAKIEDFDFTNERRGELLFVEKAVIAMKPGREIAIVVNDGALESPSREIFRKKLLQNCDLYAIISLTKFAFAPYTKEKTYVLFLRKKQEKEIGEIQEFPIWHFILDYDGFANSDKRYRTKYHDDIPELEEKFDEAVKTARIYLKDKHLFEKSKSDFEREVNERERQEGLWGMKYGYLKIDEINENNFYNLLNEFYLRPIKTSVITKKEYTNGINQIKNELGDLIDEIEKLMKER